MALPPDLNILIDENQRTLRLIRCGRDALAYLMEHVQETSQLPPPSHTTFPNFGGVPVLEGGELQPHEVELIDGAGRVARWFITPYGVVIFKPEFNINER